MPKSRPSELYVDTKKCNGVCHVARTTRSPEKKSERDYWLSVHLITPETMECTNSDTVAHYDPFLIHSSPQNPLHSDCKITQSGDLYGTKRGENRAELQLNYEKTFVVHLHALETLIGSQKRLQHDISKPAFWPIRTGFDQIWSHFGKMAFTDAISTFHRPQCFLGLFGVIQTIFQSQSCPLSWFRASNPRIWLEPWASSPEPKFSLNWHFEGRGLVG